MKRLVITILTAGLVLATTPVWAQTCNSHIPKYKPDSIYVDNGNGTVTDTQTGLIWQKCSMGQNYDKAANSCTGTAKTYTWQEALEAVQTANQNELLGFSDWRLPSIVELTTLVERACTGPAINESLFPNTVPGQAPSPATGRSFVSAWYWSSSPVAYDTYGAWAVDFYDGYTEGGNKINYDHVRLVRGGQ